jgi:PhnB protein
MAEQDRIEQLDAAIDAILAGRAATGVEGEAADLLTIASALREVANPHFKAQLKWKVVPRVRHTLVPHCRVRGVPAFIEFLERAFGATEEFRAPMPDGSIAHAEVRIGDSSLEMGDAIDDFPPIEFAMHLYVDNVDELYQRAVAAGATSVRPVVDQFYGDREGTVKDPFGNQWYIASPVREGYRTITPFLHPRGTDRAIEFVRSAFGGEIVGEPYTTPQGYIAHVVMRVGDSLLEMGEGPGDWKPLDAGMHLYVDDCDAVYQRAVAAGAKTIYGPYDAPYGERTAYVIDPWGNHWYIGTPK